MMTVVTKHGYRVAAKVTGLYQLIVEASDRLLTRLVGASVPVARERVTQRILERSEPRLVVAPLVHGLAGDGLTHLLGACAAHTALGAVELHACPLEWQP